MTVMYLGPTLNGIVRHNQIFAYHPEEIIERACGVNMLARHLFVSMDDDIVSAKKELNRQGSFLSLAYQKMEKEADHGRL